MDTAVRIELEVVRTSSITSTSSVRRTDMDTIDPTSCPAAIREPSVRADADDSDTSRRTEAEETIILVTTSMNRLSFEEQRVAHRGAQEGRHPHSVPRLQEESTSRIT